METQKMTIKEMAQVSGCSAKTIGRYANRLFPDHKKGRGFVRGYSKEESIEIMNTVPKKNYVDIPEKGQSFIQEGTKFHSNNTLITNLFSSLENIIEKQQLFMKEVLSEIKRPTQHQLPPPVKNHKVLPVTKSRRSELVQIVRKKAYDLKMPEAEAWNRLYTEVKYSWPLKMDLKKRAANKGVSNLEYAERENLIPQLIEYAKEI